ncbi:MAG: glycosyltransferase family 39 protein [Defluviitaleaceae bacterium]|nr:glycosyltransferase family 39 protein [Defluviitaleaceae bacterium]
MSRFTPRTAHSSRRDILFWLPFLLLLAGVLVRAIGLGSIPAGVNQDEAMAAYDAYSLSLYGCDRLGMHMPVYFTAWGYGQMSVLMSYLMIPFIKIFGFSAVSIRMPTLLVSVAGLWVLYLFVRDLLGREAGCAALFFAAINPWQIMQSRWALDCNMFPHFVLFAVYALYRGTAGRPDRRENSPADAKREARKRLIYLCASMFLFAMCMYTYGIAFYTIPLLLAAYAVYLLAAKKISAPRLLICAGVYLLFAWPAFGVMAVNYFKLPSVSTPLFTIPYFPNGQRMSDVLFFSGDIPGQFVKNLTHLVNDVFLQKPDLIWNTIPQFGPLYKISVPFAAVGAIWLIWKKTGKSGFVFVWLGAAAVSGLIADNVNINRINIIFYPMIILAGIGVYGAGELAARLLGLIRKTSVRAAAAKVRVLLTAVILLAYAALFGSFAGTYFGSYATQIQGNFYTDFLGCLDYAARQDPDVYYISACVQFKNSSNVAEILTLFSQKIDPAYFRGERDPDAQEHDLSYKQRYMYPAFSMIKDIPAPPEGETAIYIVNKTYEQGKFPAEDYDEVYESGKFCVLERRG